MTDAGGQVVGLGEVLVGKYMESDYEVSSFCAVPFEVPGIKDGDEFYGVAISELPMERYTRADLDAPITIIVPQS